MGLRDSWIEKREPVVAGANGSGNVSQMHLARQGVISEEKTDHVWRGTKWQLARGAWVCGTQRRRCMSASRSCRGHSQVP